MRKLGNFIGCDLILICGKSVTLSPAGGLDRIVEAPTRGVWIPDNRFGSVPSIGPQQATLKVHSH